MATLFATKACRKQHGTLQQVKRKPREPEVSARIASLVVAFAESRGASLSAQLAASGVARSSLADADARIALSVEEAIWSAAAQACSDPQFGLHAAQAIRPGMFHVLDYVVRTAPTMREALLRLARYNRLLHDLATFEVQELSDCVRVVHGFGDDTPASPHAAEFTLASIIVVGRQLSSALQVLAVEFAHAPLGGTEDYVQTLGVIPRFSCQANAVVLARAGLDAVLPSADPALSRIVTRHADDLLAALPAARAPFSSNVRKQVATHISDGAVSLGVVARRLNLSERSLQRRLDEEGLRFADIVEEVRKDLALRYIADPALSLGEVAFLLGFSEPSPFHRAFKRWTGSTPAQARRAHH